ncbi:hypothetical protein CEXT_803741 [Caerostris extrusa]|uniref:Uncharacterized protein n=1 Tax=Caerostris extrusa TaxID=172846 RepID=A0AAV4YD77_CAEEX|nr:hypothetical protein CEXT_803741 [Caerostris extrusa]
MMGDERPLAASLGSKSDFSFCCRSKKEAALPFILDIGNMNLLSLSKSYFILNNETCGYMNLLPSSLVQHLGKAFPTKCFLYEIGVVGLCDLGPTCCKHPWPHSKWKTWQEAQKIILSVNNSKEDNT